MSTCAIAECSRSAHARGWCITHYRRWRVHGDVSGGTTMRHVRSPCDRFEDKINREGPIPAFRPALGPCWLWTGAIMLSGHGRFENRTAQSFSYELFAGPIPLGLEIDHLCRVRSCVNPNHLEPVTHKENMARGHFALMQTCPFGHPYDGDNLYITGKGHRQCRICKRAAFLRWKAKQ